MDEGAHAAASCARSSLTELHSPWFALADALAAVVAAAQPGAKIVDLCMKGDSMIEE